MRTRALHALLLSRSPRGPEAATPGATSTPRTPILASKHHPPLRTASYPGGTAAPEAGAARDAAGRQGVTESVWGGHTSPREGSRGGRVGINVNVEVNSDGVGTSEQTGVPGRLPMHRPPSETRCGQVQATETCASQHSARQAAGGWGSSPRFVFLKK